MASLEALPPDQRAVLQLVLQRGRSYDDIALLLSIDRAAVRQRALAAFDALGPHTRVEPERRALITDYLLRQLPSRVGDDTRNRLAESASERAWARVVASELAPLAAQGLPEIPAEARGRDAAPSVERPAADEPAQAPPPARAAPAPSAAAAPVAAADTAAMAEAARAGAAEDREDGTPRIPKDLGLPEPEPTGGRSSSRIGGAVLLGLGALVAIVVVVVLLLTNSGSSKHSPTSPSAATTAPSTATGTAGASTTPRPVAQINLTSPTGNSKTAGIAQVVRQGAQSGIVIAAAGVPANTKHDAYAAWLYKSPTKAKILGFVNPGVGANGKLSTAGALPADAGQYSQLLVTLETQATPHAPGKIVLQGALSLG
jgi:hypothetical protein